jgi:activator of HSP90 ATPase
MSDRLEMQTTLPAAPDAVFAAWMSGDGHSAMTGAPASVDPVEGGRFTAWEGYIEGHTVVAEPGRRIVQRWRSTDFPAEAPDSLLEVHLVATAEGTRLTLVHTEIPAGQGPNYEQGWQDFYFTPMRDWFGK